MLCEYNRENCNTRKQICNKISYLLKLTDFRPQGVFPSGE